MRRPFLVSRRAKAGAISVALLGVLTAGLLPASPVSAQGNACENRNNNTYAKLLECVTLEGVREHQAAFQAIADANDDPSYPGSRAAGTEGYAGSVDYVVGLLEDAGYNVTLDEFEFTFVFPAELQQVTPTPTDYETGTFTGSGSADVTTAITAVDINVVAPMANSSGCDGAFTEGGVVGNPIVADPAGPDDFAGFTAGNIALLQRGSCSFALKAINAQAAGASAVIIFNQGNDPTRVDLIVGNAAPPVGSTAPAILIPVVGASFEDGVALSGAATARVKVSPSETRTDVNVIAELPGKNTNNVVMAGAHLDSVGEGPGINDNGSGSAAILETALNIAKLKPENTLRFAWWGAEESGLIGSQAYVDGLSPAELDRIALYLNYDMVGSPNYIFMVYDSDESTFEAPVVVPDGSIAIEDLYESYYTMVGEPYDDTEFSGRSDYEAFINAGIPSGGLFTGAEEVKTAQQQAIWGGETGEQFDPCYHLDCDTFANNNNHALEINSDLIAFVQMTYAYSTETVNGVKGKKVPGPPLNLPAPAGPEGTFLEP